MLGFKGLDIASALLAENLSVDSSDLLLDFYAGAGLVGTVAASVAVEGKSLMTDSNVAAAEAARRTVEANGAGNVTVVLSSGTSHVKPERPADVVSVRLPKGKLPALQMIWDGFNILKQGGLFYIAGANDEGIKTYLEATDELFGEINIIAYRKGHRVGVAKKSILPFPLPQLFTSPLLDHSQFHIYVSQLRGNTYRVCSRPGVFSWDHLDEGTRILIETMEIHPNTRVLDLGCGTGIIGSVAANLAHPGEVYMVDSNIDAVASAQRTSEANRLRNCTILASDSVSAVRHLKFDVVVTNPPFHLGKATEYDMAIQFIRDAADILKRNGRLYLVANRFIPYETDVQSIFGTLKTLYQDRRYKILMATV